MYDLKAYLLVNWMSAVPADMTIIKGYRIWQRDIPNQVYFCVFLERCICPHCATQASWWLLIALYCSLANNGAWHLSKDAINRRLVEALRQNVTAMEGGNADFAGSENLPVAKTFAAQHDIFKWLYTNQKSPGAEAVPVRFSRLSTARMLPSRLQGGIHAVF